MFPGARVGDILASGGPQYPRGWCEEGVALTSRRHISMQSHACMQLMSMVAPGTWSGLSTYGDTQTRTLPHTDAHHRSQPLYPAGQRSTFTDRHWATRISSPRLPRHRHKHLVPSATEYVVPSVFSDTCKDLRPSTPLPQRGTLPTTVKSPQAPAQGIHVADPRTQNCTSPRSPISTKSRIGITAVTHGSTDAR